MRNLFQARCRDGEMLADGSCCPTDVSVLKESYTCLADSTSSMCPSAQAQIPDTSLTRELPSSLSDYSTRGGTLA